MKARERRRKTRLEGSGEYGYNSGHGMDMGLSTEAREGERERGEREQANKRERERQQGKKVLSTQSHGRFDFSLLPLCHTQRAVEQKDGPFTTHSHSAREKKTRMR